MYCIDLHSVLLADKLSATSKISDRKRDYISRKKAQVKQAAFLAGT